MTFACAGIPIGTPLSVAIGRAYLLRTPRPEVHARRIPPDQVAAECDRFREALREAQDQLQSIQRQIPDATAAEISAFVDTHLLMLRDPALTEVPLRLIREEHWSAEWALQIQRNALIRLFEEMDDPYLRTRRDDIEHLVDQVQHILLRGEEAEGPVIDGQLSDRIIVARNISPAQTLLMRHHGVAGFVTEAGGPMSHTAILARSLGLPAVIGVHGATELLRHDEILIVDSRHGMVLADTDTSIQTWYRRRIIDYRLHRARLRNLRHLPAVTRDGEAVNLMANIELPEDIEDACNNAAVGIGLYRTEFLYMNRDGPPDEEEHLETYRRVVHGLNGIPLTIRTLDLGADKQHAGHFTLPDTPACNPALGLRAIRLCLKEPQLFRPQLRAILRIAAEGPVRLMLPMLTSLEELIKVRTLIEDLKEELRRDGLPFDPDLPVGGMVEVPAAALCADLFARNLDFLSLGTNDLIQYTLAIDRADDEVNYLFDPLHPAVLRLIKTTIDAARRQRTPLSMCGEMAGDPTYTRLLLGMGLREFSMRPGALLEIKRIVRDSDTSRLSEQVELLFSEHLGEDLMPLLQDING